MSMLMMMVLMVMVMLILMIMIVMVVMTSMIVMMVVIVMLILAHGWRPPRGGKRAQRDSVLKLIVIHFAKIQNWGRC